MKKRKIDISIVVSVWGTEHLMKRSIETWSKQDYPKDRWELIVINDGALGDVKSIIEPYKDKINIQYIEFCHNAGMRGNTIALNTGWMCSSGTLIAESTPETMWPPELVRGLVEGHYPNGDTSKPMYENRFVLFKTYNLVQETQLLIDTVDWKDDIYNIKNLPGWDHEITQLNRKIGIEYGNHQTDSIRKDTWYKITDGLSFALYSGYGEDDCYHSGLRKNKGIQDCVVMDEWCQGIHQHHLPWDYFRSLGHSPVTNNKNHSIGNIFNDISGRVPENGTCEIFDGGDKSQEITDEQMRYWRSFDEYFIKSGGDPKYLEPKFDYYKKYCYFI